MDNQSTSSAMGRIRALLDESSFVEIGALVRARSTDFNLAEKKLPSDGVITGYGTISGRLVYVYSQDSAVLGGSVGEMHGKKIAALYDMAMKMGAPLIELIDCSGLRLQEASDSLFGMGRIYRKKTAASGVIPQLSAVFGSSGGGMAVLTALSDFVFMEKEKGRLFVNAPDAVLGNKDDRIAMAEAQEENGLVDFSGSEEEILGKLRELFSLLPSNNEDYAEPEGTEDDLNRAVSGIENLSAPDALRLLSDDGVFFRTKRGYAPDLVTGFLRLNGQTVGAVMTEEKSLSWKGAEQAAGLIRFCDAYEIPVLTIVDTEGYQNSGCTEKHMAKAAAKLAYAYTNASVPLVTVIRNAIGTAGLSLGSKALGADIVYAYPDARIGILKEEKSAELLFPDSDRESIQRQATELGKTQNSAQAAAERGYLDDIILPEETRQRVIAALEMLYTKTVSSPDKKHGTV